MNVYGSHIICDSVQLITDSSEDEGEYDEDEDEWSD